MNIWWIKMEHQKQICIGIYQLKKKGGSQLASGMTGETIATFNADIFNKEGCSKKNKLYENKVEDNFKNLGDYIW